MASPATPLLEIDQRGFGSLVVGDEVPLRVRFSADVAETEVVWRSGNTGVARITPAGTLVAVSPGSATVTASLGGLTARADAEVHDLPARYGPEAIEYFDQVAFGTEAGNAVPRLRRWAVAPRVLVYGSPTPRDLATVDEVLAELNDLVPALGMTRVTDGPNLELHFIPLGEFPAYEPNYVPGNLGYFWVWWNRANEITHARVLVATEDVTQEAREHLVREELTQALGLMCDAWTYPESVFYQGWTETRRFAPIDRTLVEMLYRPDLHAGQSREEALAVLRAARADRSASIVP